MKQDNKGQGIWEGPKETYEIYEHLSLLDSSLCLGEACVERSMSKKPAKILIWKIILIMVLIEIF